MTDPTEVRRRLRHDCRSSLNQIIGYAEMLQEQAEDDELPDYIDDLAKIERAGRTLLTQVDQLASAPGETPVEGLPPVDPAGPSVELEASINATWDTSFELDPILPSSGSEEGAGHLLVVDDNELNRDLLARRLTKTGYQVTTASGGQDALAQLGQQPFDLVLLDVMMPDISGLDVLVALRMQFEAADLPVIMATARNASEDLVEALRRGANDYVTKPLDMPVVLARVEAQLALKRARDEVQRLNHTLATAQEKIAELADSASSALYDLEGWTASAASDLAAAIGVDGLDVWLVESGGAMALHHTGGDPPSDRDIEAIGSLGLHVERERDTVVPVLGLSGELYGAVVIPDPTAMRVDAVARLLQSFARQLGGSLELRRARQELDDADELRRARVDDMLARGIDLLRVCPECQRCYDQTHTHCETDGEELEVPPPFPFRIAERYRLVRVLGEGGMGTVFEARDERLRRVVAVKVIRGEHFDDDLVRLRFENEARAVARIAHPGVIAVFDSGEIEDGSLYIVMEFLEGHDLGDLVRCFGRGTPAQVASLARQGASALAAAHGAGIIHRDIKPENIVLVPTGEGFRVKILDFGVAKEVSSETRLTQTGTLVGTPMYMSPEQIMGKQLDSRSDLYSFASVLYLALTGRRVTTGEGIAEVMMDVLKEVPPAVTDLRPSLPAGVDRLFSDALSKTRDERPADIESWSEGLCGMLEGVTVGATGWRPDALDLPASGLELQDKTEFRGRQTAPTDIRDPD